MFPGLGLTPRSTLTDCILLGLCRALQAWTTAAARLLKHLQTHPSALSTGMANHQSLCYHNRAPWLSPRRRPEFRPDTGQEGSTAAHLTVAASVLHFALQHCLPRKTLATHTNNRPSGPRSALKQVWVCLYTHNLIVL